MIFSYRYFSVYWVELGVAVLLNFFIEDNDLQVYVLFFFIMVLYFFTG